MLDRRLGTARYRWDIVRALPPMRRTRDRAEVEAFLPSADDMKVPVAGLEFRHGTGPSLGTP